MISTLSNSPPSSFLNRLKNTPHTCKADGASCNHYHSDNDTNDNERAHKLFEFHFPGGRGFYRFSGSQGSNLFEDLFEGMRSKSFEGMRSNPFEGMREESECPHKNSKKVPKKKKKKKERNVEATYITKGSRDDKFDIDKVLKHLGETS
jgi:hypothetical protein